MAAKYVFSAVFLFLAVSLVVAELGVDLRGGEMISFTFDEGGPTAPVSDVNEIRVSFRTRRKHGIIVQFHDAAYDHYMSLEVNNGGGVRLGMGFDRPPMDRYEVNSDQYDTDLADGELHDVYLKQENNLNFMNLTVDEHVTRVWLPRRYVNSALFVPSVMHIGNNGTSTWNRGFNGCIQGLQIGDSWKPFETASEDPTPAYVQLTPPDLNFINACERRNVWDWK